MDEWLLQEAAWLSEGQAYRLLSGDHSQLVEGVVLGQRRRSGLRLRSGGRAATFLVADRYSRGLRCLEELVK